MTKVQLQEIATRKGISFTTKTSKEELEKAIAKANRATPKAAVGKPNAGEY